MILVCVGVHAVLLRFFVGQSAFIERRPDWRRPPVQIEILAEETRKPDDPPRQLPKPAEVVKKLASKPINKPKAVQAAKPVIPLPSVSTLPEPESRQSYDPVNAADSRVEVVAAGAGSATGTTSSDSVTDSPDRFSGANSTEPAREGSSKAPDPDYAVPAAAAPTGRLLIGKALPPPPASARWSYSIHMGDFEQTGSAASLKLAFENHGSAYSLRGEVSATGITALFYGGVRRDLSRGRLTDNGFEPERYVEQRSKGAERASQIDYARRQIQFAGGESEVLPEGTQDRLTSLFQLGLLARAEPDLFLPGKTVEMPEMNLRDVEKIRYLVVGPANLKTSLGMLRTLHLTRMPGTKGKDAEIDLWLDYEFNMIPVRIRLVDPNGRVIDQVIDAR